MKSLMTFIGILAFNFSNANASEFACPVAPAFSNYTCSGTVRVENMEQLNAYKSNLGVVAKKPTVAKGLLIDFSPILTADMQIATPCMIKTAPNITITSTGNVCLNGKRKILLDEGFHFSGKNLNLESSEDVVVNENSVVVAQDIMLLSKGSEQINQAFFREGAQITAANILIESHNVGFIGRNSNLQLTGSLSIHALGDEEASIRQGTVVLANKIDVNSTGVTKIANLTTLTASEITLIGAKGCDINKGSVMTTTSRIGNCFLTSSTKESFSVDKNSGTNPLTVTFTASSIAGAKGFVWDFGNGQTLNTLVPTVTHTYTTIGAFTASLMYATKENYKGLKSAGLVQIDVKAAPVVPTTPPRGYFTYAQDGTFVYLKGFIRKTQFDIATAYYVIDDNQNNKIVMTNFYANSLSNVEMNTFGQHKITMYVEDVQGQKYNTSMNIWLNNNEEDIAPIIRFYGEQSAVRSAFINMYQSFTPHPDENLKEFIVDFGDGNIEHIENAASVTHTYAQAGVYQVKVSAEYNGNVRSQTQPITVTDVNKPILNPIAGFYYFIMDYSGNVVVTDDRSQTPNGEIISYEWDFGNGIITYGQQASHFFSPGNHLVTLTVTDTAGLRSSQTQLIRTEEVGTNFVAALDCWKEGIKTLECEVIALDKDNQISRVKLEWGDGTSQIYSEAEIPAWGLYADQHTYQTYGNYNVKLTVDTTRGQTKTVSYQYAVTVNPPVASIACSSNNLLVTCNAQSATDPSGLGIESYSFDFGDGYITTPSTQGFAQHIFTAPGSYLVKVIVKSKSGFSSIATTQVVLSYAQPLASIFCSTNDMHISCNAIGFNYPQNSPIIFKFDYGDSFIESNATGFSSHVYSTVGTYEVKVVVTNGLGLTSNAQTLVMPHLHVNQPPIAKISCIAQANKILCDAVTSFDPDGGIMNVHWDFGDGTSTNGFFVEHQYEAFGQFTVTLTATDNDFLSSSVTQVIPINSFAPVVLGSCAVENQLLSCDGSESFDSDGNITEFKWILEGEKEIVGQKITYDFTSVGQKNITLKISDNVGNISSKLIGSFSITNIAPIALFGCVNTDEAHLKCSTAGSIDDGRIVSYLWDVNGSIYNGDMQEFTFSADGDYVVSLRVKDNMGLESSFSQTYSLTPSVFINKSPAQIVALDSSAQEFFYPLEGQVNFQVSNAILNQDISQNSISVNGNLLVGEKISYNFNEEKISLALSLNDGKNDITFSLLDEQGKNVSIDYVIYAGSRSVILNIAKEEGGAIQNATIELTPTADKKTTLKKLLVEGVVELNNVPNEDFSIKGNWGEFRGNNVIFKTDTDSFLTLNGYAAAAADQNNNFSQGITGWDAKNSTFTIGNNSLILSPNQQGVATLRRTLHATEENPVVTFKYMVRSSYDDEYFSLTMRNKATGETRFDFFSTKDNQIKSELGDIFGQDLKIEKSIATKSINDIVEIELKLFTRHGVVQETVMNSFFNLILLQAFAIDTSGIEGQTDGYVLDKFKILHSQLFDPVSSLLSVPLNSLSIGQLPIYPGGSRPFPVTSPSGELESSNLVYADYQLENLDFDTIASVRLQVLNPNDHYKILEDVLSTKTIQTGSSGTAIFNLKSQNIALEDIPKSVVLKLNITTKSGRQDSVFISNDKSALYFNSLISLTSYLPVINNYRFPGSTRDVNDVGGDDWIKPEHFKFIENLTLGLPRQLNVTFNDFSKMNGGKFPPHFEHGNGNVFDGFMRDYNTNRSQLVNSKESALNLLSFINIHEISDKATKVIVSYDDRTNSEFNNEIQSSCLANGRLARNFIINNRDKPLTLRDEAGHKDHFHLQFDNDVNTLGKSESYEICHMLNTDQKKISFKRCKGALLNQEMFEVWGKKFKTTGQYQKLDSSPGGYSYTVFGEAILDLKIIYKGNKNVGCFEKLIYVDTRPTEQNCEDEHEYGLTYIQYDTSELIDSQEYSSAFISETSSVKNIIINSVENYYRVPISTRAIGERYNTVSLCDNSVAQSIGSMTNTKITKGSIVGDSVISEDSYIENSKINSEIIGQQALFIKVVIKDSKVDGYFSFEFTNITNDSEIKAPERPDAPWASFSNVNIENSTVSFDGNRQYNYQADSPERGQIENSTLKNAILSNSSGQISVIKITDSTIENSTAIAGMGSIEKATIIKNSNAHAVVGNILNSKIENSNVIARSGNINNLTAIKNSSADAVGGIINANLDNSFVSNSYIDITGTFLNNRVNCSEDYYDLSTQKYLCRPR